MNSRERFLIALSGGTPDRVPVYEFHWNPRLISEVLGRPAGAHNMDDEVEMSRRMGIDMVWAPAYGFSALWNCQTPPFEGRYQDEWGTWYGTNEHAWPAGWPEVYPVETPEDWERVLARAPDPTDPKQAAQARRAVELAGGELAILGGVRGPFSAAWMLIGLVNMSMMVYEAPDFLLEVFRALARWNTAIALELVHAGVDAIVVNDDYGMNDKLFISPRDWRHLVLPVFAEQVDALAAAGVPVILHSDGNLNAILDDLTGLRLAGMHPWQRSAKMDLADAKRRFGHKLCLLGNVSVTTTLPHGTPDDVRRETLECLRDAAPGGGYILAADHSFHGGIPTANVWAALETNRKFGRYPLDMSAILDALADLDRRKEAA